MSDAPNFKKGTEERFWTHVGERGDGCWEWKRPGKNGYGYMSVANRPTLAHRLSWMLEHNEEVPAGMFVCHHCDNRQCVRPDHLFVGSQKDNIRDAARKGRLNTWSSAKTHCKRGHELVGSNLHVFPNGVRGCVTCRRWRWSLYDRGLSVRDVGAM